MRKHRTCHEFSPRRGRYGNIRTAVRPGDALEAHVDAIQEANARDIAVT